MISHHVLLTRSCWNFPGIAERVTRHSRRRMMCAARRTNAKNRAQPGHGLSPVSWRQHIRGTERESESLFKVMPEVQIPIAGTSIGFDGMGPPGGMRMRPARTAEPRHAVAVASGRRRHGFGRPLRSDAEIAVRIEEREVAGLLDNGLRESRRRDRRRQDHGSGQKPEPGHFSPPALRPTHRAGRQRARVRFAARHSRTPITV